MNTLLPPTSLVGKPIIYFTIIETCGLFKISKLTIRFENFLILYRHTSIDVRKMIPTSEFPVCHSPSDMWGQKAAYLSL